MSKRMGTGALIEVRAHEARPAHGPVLSSLSACQWHYTCRGVCLHASCHVLNADAPVPMFVRVCVCVCMYAHGGMQERLCEKSAHVRKGVPARQCQCTCICMRAHTHLCQR